MINAKIISSLEKCFPQTEISALRPLRKISALRGERLSFQLAFREEDPAAPHRAWVVPRLSGELAPFARLRLVEYIPSLMPIYPGRADEGYITTEPGLFPDLLAELPMKGSLPACNFQTRCALVTIEIPKDFPGGTYEMTLELIQGEQAAARCALEIAVIPALLPGQKLLLTQWLHCDCLADYYGVEVFSGRHWEIIEDFVRTAVKNGQNTLLTPIFTPPLDTAVGGERPTVQLVDVTVEKGQYRFSYPKLDRWLDMCGRVGIEYFEISHFFTQWGAAHAPKVMATVDGEYRRIFGWESAASEGEYPRFLRAFIPDFLSHMRSRGLDRRCIFHISDEPNEKHLEQYARSRAVVADLLKGYMVIDALSDIEFWKSGHVQTPVPASNHIEPFLEAGVPGLWTYYCCGQTKGVSNRFFAMPGARTRFLGVQLYKYGIVGFLQWGYNFYYNQGSVDFVNPYLDSTGGYFVPSGDAFVVYPGKDGQPLESLRLAHFYEGLQDLRALELCESFYGKARVVEELEKLCGEIKFSRCLLGSGEMLAVREKVNSLIANAIK